MDYYETCIVVYECIFKKYLFFIYLFLEKNSIYRLLKRVFDAFVAAIGSPNLRAVKGHKIRYYDTEVFPSDGGFFKYK